MYKKDFFLFSDSNSQSSSQSQSLNRTNSTASISSSKDDDNSRDSQQEEASAPKDSPEKSDTPGSTVPSSPTSPFNKEHAALFSSHRASETSDSVRLKCRELLATALKAPCKYYNLFIIIIVIIVKSVGLSNFCITILLSII